MILWDDDQDKVIVDDRFYNLMEEIVKYSLSEEGVNIPCELSITLVDNEAIREINNEYRHMDKVTDVLSFPMLSYPDGLVFNEFYAGKIFGGQDLDGDQLVLGDIVISLETALSQSKEYSHSFLREACYLTVHSILHLLGYDHMNPNDKKRMRVREENILKKFDMTRGRNI
ncbi:MAG TPA: rRNA maturation RNase YbeY [Clostridiaceae bacterium]|nr:rRNA maturation RNase YbeY [Clostridiaceae bacterium]